MQKLEPINQAQANTIPPPPEEVPIFTVISYRQQNPGFLQFRAGELSRSPESQCQKRQDLSFDRSSLRLKSN